MADDDADYDADAAYGNNHRAFLQSFLSRQTLTLSEAKPIIAQIETTTNPRRPTTIEDVTKEDFEAYIQTANTAISAFDLEIRSSFHQITKERIYALVNTTSDALTQMATLHSPDDIAFVKRVIDAMFDTYNTQRAEVMAIAPFQALKLAKVPGEGSQRRESGNQTQTQGREKQSQNASLMASQAEKVLKSMVGEGWFEQNEETMYYSLSQRALMELRGSLVDSYNDDPDEEDEEEPRVRIKFCKSCGEMVTVGQRCPNLPCNTRFHDFCVNSMWRVQQNSKTCPTCKTAWVDPPPVGERAARNAGGGGRREPRPSTNGASRRSSGRNGDVECDPEDGAELYE